MVAELDPFGWLGIPSGGGVEASDMEGGSAKLVDVDLDVVGGSGKPVVVGDTVGAVMVVELGAGTMKLLELLVEPAPPACRCRAL